MDMCQDSGVFRKVGIKMDKSTATQATLLHRLRLNQHLIGRAQILLSAVGFGAIGLLAKSAYQSGLNAPSLLTLRFVLAAIILWLYFLLFNREAIRIGRKEFAICAILGLAGYVVFSSLVFKAFESTPASVVTILFFSYPVFVMFLGWAVMRERPALQFWLGALLILSGLSVGVSRSLMSEMSVGCLLAVGGAAWYAAYLVAAHRLLNKVKPQTVALYVISFAAVSFWLIHGTTVTQLSALPISAWVAVGLLALFSTVMALLLFFAGLQRIGAAEASQLGTIELILSLIFAAVGLSEPISAPLVLGAGLILIGILISQVNLGIRRQECLSEKN